MVSLCVAEQVQSRSQTNPTRQIADFLASLRGLFLSCKEGNVLVYHKKKWLSTWCNRRSHAVFREWPPQAIHTFF
jgi:hypothetical protein